MIQLSATGDGARTSLFGCHVLFLSFLLVKADFRLSFAVLQDFVPEELVFLLRNLVVIS